MKPLTLTALTLLAFASTAQAETMPQLLQFNTAFITVYSPLWPISYRNLRTVMGSPALKQTLAASSTCQPCPPVAAQMSQRMHDLAVAAHDFSIAAIQ